MRRGNFTALQTIAIVTFLCIASVALAIMTPHVGASNHSDAGQGGHTLPKM